MRNIIKILFVGFFSLFGCTSILEEEPYSFFSSETLLDTEEGADLAIVGVYDRLNSFDYELGSFRRGLLITANFGTDDFNSNLNNNAFFAPYDNYTVLPQDPNLNQIWLNFYAGINQATSIIEKLPSKNFTEAKKKRIVAEAKFLRGIFYFYLVRLFGEVPILKTETVDLSNLHTPRASIQDVYGVIIKDFTDAAIDLPNRAGTPEGRATKAAALGFLSKVYLSLGSYGKYKPVAGYDWVNTTDAFTKAVDFGEQTLAFTEYTLTNNYSEIFETDNSAEVIFSVEMYGASGFNEDGSFVGNLFAPGAIGNVATSRGGQAQARPTRTLLNKYQTGDTRRTWNIVNFRYNVCTEVPFTQTYPGKYRKPCDFTGAQQSTSHDHPLLRLADVMLMVAEASTELNGGVATPRALELVDQLRVKRFAANVTPPAITGNFLNFIFDERSREFVYEGQRWYDLARTKRLVDAVKGVVAIHGNPLGKNNIKEHHYLFPIPQNEIDNNDAISNEDQNPGY